MADLRRFFISHSAAVGETVALEGEEFHHMAQVLRHRVGDEVILCPGDGTELTARIVSLEKACARLEILAVANTERESDVKLHLFQAMLKGDKMELVVQKAVELGIAAVHPFLSEFTVAKENQNKTDRLNKIAVEAAKQCKRAVPVPVSETLSFAQALEWLNEYDAIIFCCEFEREQTLKQALRDIAGVRKVAVIVGSEGGFSEREAAEFAKIGAVSVTLGKRILRAETAAVSACAICMYELD